MPEGFSTDSYKLPTTSSTDFAQKYGAIQQQQLQISQQKLDQANQGFTYLTRAMASIGPNPGPDWKQKYLEVGANAVKMGLVPEQQLQVWADRVNQAPDSNTFFKQTISAVQEHQQILHNYVGQPANVNNGATDYQGIQGGAFNPGFRPATQSNQQYPPGTQFNQGGQAKTLGPAGGPGVMPVAGASGAVSQSQPRSTTLPVERPTTGVTGPTVRRPDMETGAPNRSGSLNAAPPPMFEEGKKMMVRDQDAATAKATSLKPLEEAYDLAKSASTGPGTEALNKGRAYLINAGLISANEKSPTVIYQMLNKNLAQFVDKNGSRSDADLAVKESGNANAKSQVQPALLHMVQKIIARERIEIARPAAFGSDKFENYGAHSSSFPTSQDERAYAIDKMPKEDAKTLYKDMREKALNGNLEGIKFLKSLTTAKKAGVVNGINQ